MEERILENHPPTGKRKSRKEIRKTSDPNEKYQEETMALSKYSEDSYYLAINKRRLI